MTELARAVLSVRPLAEALESGIRVPQAAGTEAGTARFTAALLDVLAGELGVPGLSAAADGPGASGPAAAVPGAGAAEGPGVFERVVAERLALAGTAPVLAAVPAGARDEVLAGARRIARQVAAEGFDRHRVPQDAVTPDGAALRVYAAGDPGRPAVVLASACGMPAQLCEPWIELLARDHHVVTWESRGLFGAVPDFDALERDTAAQAGDLLTVMDHCGIGRAHVMGFCGGAVIALAAAATRPDRVTSLSLWHGAYELGSDCPKADHHRNMQALMEMAAQDRATAAGVHSVFAQTMTAGAPPGMAHLVLYPYATPELLYRYCRVNGPITDIDVRDLLPGVRQPTLVVTSEDDHTADPAGSRWVAARLPDAELRVEPHGDHISLFTMGGSVGRLALEFLAGVGHPLPSLG